MDNAYTDFCDTLDETERGVFHVIHEHLKIHCPAYEPLVTGPAKTSPSGWTLNYRKNSKTGKAVCTLQSLNGKLSVRVCFLSEMSRSVLQRQEEFSMKFKNCVLRQMVCCAEKGCRAYGGNSPCPYRQNFWVNHRLIKTCPYPWILFDELTESDAADITRLLDMQITHMTQDSKEVKGGAYTAENHARCGEVRIITLEDTKLALGSLALPNYTKKPAALDKYAHLYHLTPMGAANDGFWFMRGGAHEQAYAFPKIPQGRYASVTISSPTRFSANRPWNYICEWLRNEKTPIQEILLDEKTPAVYFTKFFIEDGEEYMQALVPVQA